MRYAPKIEKNPWRLIELVIIEQIVTTIEGTVATMEEIALTGGGEKYSGELATSMMEMTYR
jgi:hypothetical protein